MRSCLVSDICFIESNEVKGAPERARLLFCGLRGVSAEPIGARASAYAAGIAGVKVSCTRIGDSVRRRAWGVQPAVKRRLRGDIRIKSENGRVKVAQNGLS